MAVKDYYKILDLPPNASVSDVKKNFRKLALRYHPDVNNGNQYAEAWYREIKEAYEVLTDKTLLEAYLQERWLLKSQGKPFADTTPLTPDLVLKQVIQLLVQVKEMDHFRMDHQRLQANILAAISPDKMNVLSSWNNTAVNKKIVGNILETLQPLPFPLIPKIVEQLRLLAVNDMQSTQEINQYFITRKRRHFWDKYDALIIFAITCIICLVIYLINR